MKLFLTLATLLPAPLYAHVNNVSEPQHGLEHLLIGVALIAVVGAGFYLLRKTK